MKKRVLLIILSLFAFSHFTYATEYFLSPGDSIQDAVDNASDGDIITLSAGTYNGSGSTDVIYIENKSLTIRAANIEEAYNYIIDGGGTGVSLIHVEQYLEDGQTTNPSYVTIQGLTLTNAGRVAVRGYGEIETGGKLTIQNCIISDNVSTKTVYAGIYLQSMARVDIISCLITDNECGNVGAGLYAEKCKMLSIIKSVIGGNVTSSSDSHGAGCFINSCEAQIRNTLIYSNSCLSYGAGLTIYNQNTTDSDRKVSFYNCMVNGNTSNKGAGIYIGSNANVEIYNSVLCGNKNYAVYSNNAVGDTVIKNCIFWDNSGGQIFLASDVDDTDPVDVTYSFVEDGYSFGKHILTANPNFKQAGEWVDGVWDEPYITNADGWGWRLGSLSKAIDGGDPNYLPPAVDSQDIDGDHRFIGRAVDIGIDEFSNSESGKVYNVNSETWYWEIDEALNNSNSGDTVVVTPGKYTENLNLSNFDSITLRGLKPYNDDFKKFTLIDVSGTGAPGIILSSNNGPGTVISGLTIKGGKGYRDNALNATLGGGIYSDGSSATIQYCRLEDNTAQIGAGLAINGGSPNIIGCVINRNISTYLGTGVAAINNSSPTFYNCAINSNKTDNPKDANTGALHIDSTSVIQDSIIRNCLFKENLPYAIYKDNSAALEINSTIFANNTYDPNVGDDHEFYSEDMDTFELNYCDIKEWEGSGTDNSYTIPSYESDTFTNDEGELESTDHDYRAIISSGSFINLGDTNYEPEEDDVDIRGHKRKDYCRIDIGPYETDSLSGALQAYPALVINNSESYCTIQEAIDEAEENKAISITKGYYNENLIIDKEGLTISGATTYFGIDEIVLDGSTKILPEDEDEFAENDPNDPNFYGAAITLVRDLADNTQIQKITIKGGKGSLDMDGHYCGGAIHSRDNANVKLYDSIIKDNAAFNGGGIYITGAESVDIESIRFFQNSAENTGGALYISECDELSVNTIVAAQNSATEGAAIYTNESDVTIDFSTISDNTNTEDGGVINIQQTTQDVLVNNCIITGNSPENFTIEGSDPNWVYDIGYSCIEGGFEDGDHIIDVDPCFIDPTDLNYDISAYSDCIGMANPDSAVPQDMAIINIRSTANTVTPWNYVYDLGAYEVKDVLDDYKIAKPVYNQTRNKYYYTIQDAVTDAYSDNTILLAPGIYQENISIFSSGLTIKGMLEPASESMKRTIISGKVVVESDDGTTSISDNSTSTILLSEFFASNIHLEGLTICNGEGESLNLDDPSDSAYSMRFGGAILSLYNEGLTLKWCSLVHNTTPGSGGAMALIDCSQVKLEHCLIANNSATRKRGGAIYAKNIYSSISSTGEEFGMIIDNCTITANTATNANSTSDEDFTQCGGILLEDCVGVTIKNSIIDDNTPNNMSPLDDTDNITASNNLIPGLSGENTYTFDADFYSTAIYDYHLKSTKGRWSGRKRKWETDSLSSEAIDAGDGTAEQLAEELYPNGDAINLGIYGGSREASLSSVAETTETTDADFSGDDSVNISDLAILSAKWYSDSCFDPADINRDCIVDLADLETLATGWLTEVEPEETGDESGE